MTTPRIQDVLTMTAAGLTALSKAPFWMALTIALPPVLIALARIFNEMLASVSRFRTASMRRRQEDRLLSEATDIGTALAYLERVQAQPLAPTAAGEPTATPTNVADPPPATPP
ncbi:hypothetical protein OHB33_40590 (plasmid) [Streptomyces sp. NBC_01558]|uniref:hypothetical protein n=1 Tax=Streptomyces sp. NBC_01558 TaxID=2975878 RepID=UPI002DD7E8B2|nr:hypothetical protein [Streptomyces sp. NBC_01558]WSD74821.1 hypothetical protein OHB33_00015 [Streptomyces sp. NBC_01558]WSD82690.1 hypothetical protein OHB33_40590 [Streptomyces sp. NBC_01558]